MQKPFHAYLMFQAKDVSLDLCMEPPKFLLMFVLRFGLYTKTNFIIRVVTDFFVGLLRLLRRIVMFCGETITDVDNLLLIFF